MASVKKLAAWAALSAAGLMMLSACGEPTARPMDDEFAGDSGETAADASGKSCCDGAQEPGGIVESDSAAEADGATGAAVAYADGEYAAIGQYGPVGEDTIDVYVGVQGGLVRSVRVVGHPFTSISKGHQEAFADEVPGVVTGKPIADLKVSKVAGASWTSEAFNAALDEVRRQAAGQASHQAE